MQNYNQKITNDDICNEDFRYRKKGYNCLLTLQCTIVHQLVFDASYSIFQLFIRNLFGDWFPKHLPLYVFSRSATSFDGYSVQCKYSFQMVRKVKRTCTWIEWQEKCLRYIDPGSLFLVINKYAQRYTSPWNIFCIVLAARLFKTSQRTTSPGTLICAQII